MTDPSSSSGFHQQRLHSNLKSAESSVFFSLLSQTELSEPIHALIPEHRERLFPPLITLSMFMAQVCSADHSCQNAVNQAAIERLINHQTVCSCNTGAYCRARKRIPLALIKTLTQCLALESEKMIPNKYLWQGRRVLIVDGTTVTMPDTLANQSIFPQQGCQKKGLGFPICRILGITSLASGALLNAATGRLKGKGGDEHTLLRSMLDTFRPGDILLGDALFPSYFLIAELQKRHVDLLMEQQGSRKRSTDFRKGHKLGAKDHLITLKKPKVCPAWMSPYTYEAMPDSITVRELKVGHKVLVTTLSDPKTASKGVLKELYQQRWHIEVDIRHIKTTMGMNILSCKTPEMAVKEIWTYLLAYNVIRHIMLQSASLADRLPRALSFKHSLQLWRISYLMMERWAENYQEVLYLMAQLEVGKRPGRIEPKAVKRRPKSYPLMMKPREEAREEVRANGHPKKLK